MPLSPFRRTPLRSVLIFALLLPGSAFAGSYRPLADYEKEALLAPVEGLDAEVIPALQAAGWLAVGTRPGNSTCPIHLLVYNPGKTPRWNALVTLDQSLDTLGDRKTTTNILVPYVPPETAATVEIECIGGLYGGGT